MAETKQFKVEVAGKMYMYMGTRDGVDMFKHVDTREYLA